MGRKHKESIAGYHFYNLYQNCERKHVIKYWYRLSPYKIAPALAAGASFHKAKEDWYFYRNDSQAVMTLLEELDSYRERFESEETFNFYRTRLPIIFVRWLDKFGKNDIELFNISKDSVEKEYQFKIKRTNNFIATARPDFFAENKATGRWYILDTKLTFFSAQATESELSYGNQASMYLLMAKKLFPNRNIVGLIGDIAYWNKQSTDEEKINCYRTAIITRTDKELKHYEEEIAGIYNEISDKYLKLKDKKYPERYLFPCNDKCCYSYFRACEYIDICKTDLNRKGKVPYGFIREK